MNLIVNRNKLNITGEQLMRKVGYAYFRDPNTGEESYVKRLTGDFYPRFHVYVKDEPGEINISLHLDQKHASYKGSHKHNGEYDGPVVEGEIENLKRLISNVAREYVNP